MKERHPFTLGFTLVELLASFATLLVLLVILSGIVSQTAKTWRFTTTKVEEFHASRDAFESIARRLSQATLNTYWDYQYSGTGTQQIPVKYVRQSDLRFLSGGAQTATNATKPLRPTHAVFFQAPFGFVDEPNTIGSPDFSGLGSLLNTWGYFVEFNSDAAQRPSFLNGLTTSVPERYRFRLVEMMQPSNNLNLYNLTSGHLTYTGLDWITAPLTSAKPPVHTLADNVIALVVLPKLSKEEDPTGTALAPSYSYDSTATNADPNLNPKNQLPPLIQVTLVAMDETSAARIANGATPPDLGIGALFNTTDPSGASKFATDLKALEGNLSAKRLNFRTFTTSIAIRSAKWSRF